MHFAVFDKITRQFIFIIHVIYVSYNILFIEKSINQGCPLSSGRVCGRDFLGILAGGLKLLSYLVGTKPAKASLIAFIPNQNAISLTLLMYIHIPERRINRTASYFNCIFNRSPFNILNQYIPGSRKYEGFLLVVFSTNHHSNIINLYMAAEYIDFNQYYSTIIDVYLLA